MNQTIPIMTETVNEVASWILHNPEAARKWFMLGLGLLAYVLPDRYLPKAIKHLVNGHRRDTPCAIGHLRKYELQELCRNFRNNGGHHDRGLPCTGNKAELQRRLLEHAGYCLALDG
jgi:hypothetical protein